MLLGIRARSEIGSLRAGHGFRPRVDRQIKHVLDRLHARDRVLGHRKAVRKSAHQPIAPAIVAQINRRPAHPRDRPRMLQVLPAALDQDHVALRIEIVKNRNDLDIKLFDGRTAENRKAKAAHARLDFGHSHVAGGIEQRDGGASCWLGTQPVAHRQPQRSK